MKPTVLRTFRFLDDEGDVYAEVAREAINWRGDSRSPNWGGGYGIGRQSWRQFVDDGPPVETPPELLSELRCFLLAAAANDLGRDGRHVSTVARLLDQGADAEVAASSWDGRGRRVLHATTAGEWSAARDGTHYRPAAFAEEGFTHCSTALQIGPVLNARFRGRDDIVLLVITVADQAEGAVVWENLEGGEQLFPHIYGPLPTSTVTAVLTVPQLTDGRFHLSDARATTV